MHDSDKKVILLHLLLKTEAGKMLEWLKRHAWKACKLQKGFRGSNPRLSATKDYVKIIFYSNLRWCMCIQRGGSLTRALPR